MWGVYHVKKNLKSMGKGQGGTATKNSIVLVGTAMFPHAVEHPSSFEGGLLIYTQ